MQTQAEAAAEQRPSSDRRRHPRYRWSAPIFVYLSNGSTVRAMSIEISESGMSALLSESLRPGEIVKIGPVPGGKASAMIKRQNGKVYGFEFLNLAWPQLRQIV